MPPANTNLQLATEDDAPTLASIMTAAFSASDAAYPLIWGSAPEGTHDSMSIIGLFSPVQRSDRVTYKAVDEEAKKVVGFATWGLPKVLAKDDKERGKKEEGGLPPIPGVNVDLWMDKVGGTRVYSARDVDVEKDMGRLSSKVRVEHLRRMIIKDHYVSISSENSNVDSNVADLTFCFVHPQYQRQGIASSLLELGTQEADRRKAKFWCTSTPQAVTTYEKSEWKVVETHDVDLGLYGGKGVYTRSWMVREPKMID
ncbi:hypothetical protein IFR04_009963 [Cadophora malorum]|uniref:N-acetyltransferase domain-containing protein n=1 Tax=Cadophora malorum TaxID=108018 RepID=A0A8H7TD09_9HELO|nr:hypothetical protein IFR04_009963 [Cadophora malorum]